MTEREKLILETLAAQYPSSAQATGGRPLRLRLNAVFPELDRNKPDDYESFLEAAEALEKEGIVQLDWERHRRGEDLSAIILVSPEILFQRLELPFPGDVCLRVREEAHRHATDNSGAPFFSWLANNASPKDIALAGSLFCERTVADLAALVNALDLIALGKAPLSATRALSVRLFSDSKYIESLLNLMKGFLRRAERNGIPVPLFDLVDRSYPETMIAGRVRIEPDASRPLENDSGMIIAFPFESVIRFGSILPLHAPDRTDNKKPRVLGVENKESFYALSSLKRFDAVVYVAGHPNRAVQALFRVFAQSGWDLFHSGDLDPDGILVLQELSDAAGMQVRPWMMNVSVFERYRSLSRPLDEVMHLRSAQIREDTRKLEGIEDLIQVILSCGRGVEQEIIESELFDQVP